MVGVGVSRRNQSPINCRRRAKYRSGLIDHLEGITPGALLHIQMEMEPLTVADPLKELDECSVALPLDTDEYDAPDPDATSAAHDRLSYPRKSAQHAAPVLRV